MFRFFFGQEGRGIGMFQVVASFYPSYNDVSDKPTVHLILKQAPKTALAKCNSCSVMFPMSFERWQLCMWFTRSSLQLISLSEESEISLKLPYSEVANEVGFAKHSASDDNAISVKREK